MKELSEIEKQRLNTCCDELKSLILAVSKISNIQVICGHRGKEEQEIAVISGYSKLHYPKSKHNTDPSLAVDIAPHPIDWKDIDAFILLSEIVKQEADRQEIDNILVWGGDWRKFKDYPHWEIKK
jgi:peptidoglycan L-alanyl-D-glutamate endopeptidase CwlK